MEYTKEVIARLLDPEQSTWSEFSKNAVPLIEFLLIQIDEQKKILSELIFDGGRWQLGKYMYADLDRPNLRFCNYCSFRWEAGELEQHDPSCPVLRARKILSE